MLAANLLPLFLVISQCSAKVPFNYRFLSAEHKQHLQWEQIKATQDSFDALPTTFPKPGFDLTQNGNATYLLTTLTTYDDEMPGTRSRGIISPIASVCKIIIRTFKNSTSQFTGLFRTGAIGVIRLALDGVLLGNVGNFAPSVAIKLYVDGSWSQSILAVKDPLYGQQENKDFFRDAVSNMFEFRKADIERKYGSDPEVLNAQLHNFQGFQGAVEMLPGDSLARPENTMNLGVYESAAINSDGTKVTKVIAPYQVLLVPNLALSMKKEIWGNDFRKNIYDVVKKGSVLYTVFGLRTKDSAAEVIGEVVADSRCLSSRYGDEVLFFRHPKMAWRP